MSDKPSKLSSKIKALPDTPGVYKFLDSKGKVIYVGKALKLKRRVSSYFRPGRARDSRLELLVNEVRDINIIKTASEAEALIYEAGIIKDLLPKFNVDLKDDKSYPYLKLTVNEKYPRLFSTRRRLNDGAIYYGPYVNAKLLKIAVSFMKRVFPLRTCNRLPGSVCLEYHIGQCIGSCEGKCSDKEYDELVNQLKQFLVGKKDDLITALKEQMNGFSAKREYEKAIFVKERIEALTAVQQLHDRSRMPIYGELDELQSALDLKTLPVKIECFDISNTSGQQAVGSMVRFVAGRARRSEYRKYRIKTVTGIDDYLMIREVVRRRYSRFIRENRVFPDLILIDGGKGHLSAVRDELSMLGVKDVPVASIAKKYNHLYTETRADPIRLSPGSRLLLLIQRIRDEAHRFAITYHRSLRRKEKFSTGLRDIKGIGPLREKLLLDKFGNLKKISTAKKEDLEKIGIDGTTAELIVKHFAKAL